MHRLAALVCSLLLFASAPVQGATSEVTDDEARGGACAVVHGYPIQPEWVRELNALLPQFRALWSERAPAMFEVAGGHHAFIARYFPARSALPLKSAAGCLAGLPAVVHHRSGRQARQTLGAPWLERQASQHGPAGEGSER